MQVAGVVEALQRPNGESNAGGLVSRRNQDAVSQDAVDQDRVRPIQPDGIDGIGSQMADQVGDKRREIAIRIASLVDRARENRDIDVAPGMG
jgi:hypothetical protein